MMFRKKLKKDQMTDTSPARIIPTVIVPVTARVENDIDATESTPRAMMGEKSTAPTRVKEKRRNQLRYGSHSEAMNLPGALYSNWGIQDMKMRRRQAKE